MQYVVNSTDLHRSKLKNHHSSSKLVNNNIITPLVTLPMILTSLCEPKKQQYYAELQLPSTYLAIVQNLRCILCCNWQCLLVYDHI